HRGTERASLRITADEGFGEDGDLGAVVAGFGHQSNRLVHGGRGIEWDRSRLDDCCCGHVTDLPRRPEHSSAPTLARPAAAVNTRHAPGPNLRVGWTYAALSADQHPAASSPRRRARLRPRLGTEEIPRPRAEVAHRPL